MAWTDITDPMIDPESPVNNNLFTYLRDNLAALAAGSSGAPKVQSDAIATGAITEGKIGTGAVTQNKIQDLAVNNAKLADDSVTQPKLSTLVDSQNSGSLAPSGSGSMQFASAGQYGFYPQIKGLIAAPFDAHIAYGKSNTSYVTNISAINKDGSSNNTISAQITYVTASPPYDLGDGDIPLFAYVNMVNGAPQRAAVCAEPPWRGPRITPHYERHGKKYRLELALPCSLEEAKRDPVLMERYLDALRRGERREVEVTRQLKNRDMHLRPHPFAPERLESIVLLDPMSPIMEDLAAMLLAGDDVLDLLMSGYIEIGEPVNRKAPPGITPVAVRWKDSR